MPELGILVEEPPKTLTGSRESDPRDSIPTVAQREPSSDLKTGPAPHLVERDSVYLQDLELKSRQAMQAVDTLYTAAKHAVTDAVAAVQRHALMEQAKRLESLFPDESFDFSDATGVPAHELEGFIRKHPASENQRLHREISRIYQSQSSRLNRESQQLEQQEQALKTRALESRGSPQKLREVARELQALHQEQKSNLEKRKLLEPKMQANQAPPSLQSKALLDLAQDIEVITKRRQALSEHSHPLRKKIEESRKVLQQLEAFVRQDGCLCQQEMSLAGPSHQPTSLCVLRSASTGKPKVWMARYLRDCASDCARWLGQTSYTDLCGSIQEKQTLQSRRDNARRGLSTAERALADAEAVESNALNELMQWSPDGT